jgi:hypothetical protein
MDKTIDGEYCDKSIEMDSNIVEAYLCEDDVQVDGRINIDANRPCQCVTSGYFPHRQGKCAFGSAGQVLAPGLNVRNETIYPILVVLSQLSPLHWARVEPNETKLISCGRVFFTVSAEIYNENTVPTMLGVGVRLTAITAATIFGGTIIGVGLVGGVSGITSCKPAKVNGILADGKTVVIGGEKVGDEEYSICIRSIEL